MSKELRELLTSIPVEGITETTNSSLVYSGVGVIRTGLVCYATNIRVSISEEGIRAAVVSEKAGLDVRGSFGSPQERAEFAESVRTAVGDRLERLKA